MPDGLAIYNAIKRHKATVTTEVDGMALSIGSLIAMAGDKRRMAANAMFMVHAPWTYAGGNSKELRAQADVLDGWATAMSSSYATATGKPQPEMLVLLTDGADHYYTAEEALAMGFIEEITDAMPPAATASAGRDVASRYRNVPAAWLQASGIQNASASAQAPAAAPAAAPIAAAAAQSQEPNMPDPVTAGGTQTPDAKAIIAADRARQDGIAAAFKPHINAAGVAELLARLQRDDSVTVEAAGFQLLTHLGSTTQPVAGAGVQTVADERDKHLDAMANSVLARGAIQIDGKGPVRADGSNPYRGHKMLDIARACLVRAGTRVDGMDQMQIVGLAFTQSTSDFPVLLANVMHKTLQGAYALQEDTWGKFCHRGSVSDFRAHNRYRVGSLSNLDDLGELSKFKAKDIPDGEKESITAGTKGNIINISRQAIINDDLGAFTGLATALGRAAKRTVESDVYATLALNAGMGPTLNDGKSLFHADHNNVSTGAPTVDAFDTAASIMAAQKDVSQNEFLDLTPQIWLGPRTLLGNAKVVVNSTYDPDTANKLQRANKSANIVETIVGTPRLTGNPWFFFADHMIAPVLEVAFLDGNDTPYVELQNGFDVDGASWKVRLDYGVAGVDFRGAVRSTGV